MNADSLIAAFPRCEGATASRWAVPCGGCGTSATWRPPTVGRGVCTVSCPVCGRIYFAAQGCETLEFDSFPSGDPEDNGSWEDRIRLLKVAFLPVPPDPSAQAPPTVLHKMLGVDSAFSEQRRTERREAFCSIVGIPLDAAWRPAGAAIDLRLLNLSADGVCLRLAGCLTTPRLAIDFTSVARIAAQSLVRLVWQHLDDSRSHLGVELLNRPHEPLPAAILDKVAERP